MVDHSRKHNLGHGFPTPGPQDPTVETIMDHIFFMNDEKWKKAREFGQYDMIIVGTGFCGHAVVHRTLEHKPTAKILMVERGPFFLPDHVQNLSPAVSCTIGGISETFPWTLDGRTASGQDGIVTWQHGMLPFFGGRSNTWSAWCPRPKKEELNGWPDVVTDKLYRHDAALLRCAEELLNVQTVDKVDEACSNKPMHEIVGAKKNKNRSIYCALQRSIQKRLNGALHSEALKDVGIYRTDPAAIASKSEASTNFQKFSVTGPLLDLLQRYENLHIVTNCTVEKILSDGTSKGSIAKALVTSKGVCLIGKANLILAMGSLPPTTLIQNSFPELKNIGNRFTSHIITAITARIPKEVVEEDDDKFDELEVGAMYVAGVCDGNYKKQYHIQLSIIHDQDPLMNSNKAYGYMPDIMSTASRDQLQSSKDHVIFVCAVLGELYYRNESSFLKNKNDPDETTNSVLRIVSNREEDLKTWDAMEKATYKMLEMTVGKENKDQLEYWKDGIGWTYDRQKFRVDTLVHEGSTLYFGDENDVEAPVEASNYKIRGVENVYVTGAALWPQAGSWNPTLTMVALSLDLADMLK